MAQLPSATEAVAGACEVLLSGCADPAAASGRGSPVCDDGASGPADPADRAGRRRRRAAGERLRPAAGDFTLARCSSAPSRTRPAGPGSTMRTLRGSFPVHAEERFPRRSRGPDRKG
ncbi:hypothetical protein [Streptomyces sp. enrichment culture]|uniref:hypothetical protein n=1 Tax=Streptomyces sp. enrichment culture TaxID=1795815 RepID=UPI003F549584